jgi:cellulose synthase/poly-beta-1,6-N-acetylglucosamine synthase-like glycosyltransferase
LYEEILFFMVSVVQLPFSDNIIQLINNTVQLVIYNESTHIAILSVIAIAFVVDGLDLIIRARTASRNQPLLSEFRADLANNPPSHDPDLTVIMPAYKNPEEVDRCIHYLLKAGVPCERIIVVDDYSNDNFETATSAANFGVKVISIGRNTKKVGAVNVGLHAVDTKYVAVLDSDSILLSSYSMLAKAIEEMEILGLDAMAGRVLPCPPASMVGRGLKSDKRSLLLELQTFEFDQTMRVGRASMYGIQRLNGSYKLKYADILLISGAFGLFRTPMIREVMYNIKEETIIGEDAERTLKILAKNGQVGYSNDLLVLSACTTDMPSHFKQRVGWSGGFFRTYVSRFGWSVCKRKLAGTTYLVLLVRDLLLHPLKLLLIPSLLLYPLEFVCLIGFYIALNIFITRTVLADLKVSRTVLVLDLFYKLYMTVFAATLGYYKAILHEIKLHTIDRNRKIAPIEIVRLWNLPTQQMSR